jgi:mono/diheme cytochrome c family protein
MIHWGRIMRFGTHIGLIAASIALGATAHAVTRNVGDPVDNFRLLDHRGESHELYYLSDMKAVVLMVQDTHCGAAMKSVATFDALRDRYRSQGVAMLMLDSSLDDAREKGAISWQKVGAKSPVLLDSLQLIGESLEANRAGEVLIVDPKDWTLRYRGSLEDATAALDAMLNRVSPPRAKTSFHSCKVSMPELSEQRAHAKISYATTIAPMLSDHCVTCHRKGGIGPWQMTSYDMVKGFAPMIREVVRTQRMPPWHADPHYGVFRNNRALTDNDVKALVHWVEAGAPRGQGDDPLAALNKSWPEWAMGEPDLILEIPAFNVPATGAIPYQTPRVKNSLGRDAWLRAVDFAPSNRTLVHHILGFTSTGGAQGLRLQNTEGTRSSIGVYVPGDVPHPLPSETGVFIGKDSDYIFQIHYTANGKAATEVTHVGLYFSKEPPKFPLRNMVLMDPRLKIPPNEKSYTASVSRTLERDALLYTLMPHSHVRGVGAKYVARYPDGREEILLSVPRYDFNWQTTYELTTPKLLPKGTSLTYYSTYDNSTQNKSNPDPNIEVHWGEQTWEEMIYGDIRFRFVDETVDEGNRTSAAR